jgi:hypothetical protein
LLIPGVAALVYYVFINKDTYEIDWTDFKRCMTFQPGGLSRREGHHGEKAVQKADHPSMLAEAEETNLETTSPLNKAPQSDIEMAAAGAQVQPEQPADAALAVPPPEAVADIDGAAAAAAVPAENPFESPVPQEVVDEERKVQESAPSPSASSSSSSSSVAGYSAVPHFGALGGGVVAPVAVKHKRALVLKDPRTWGGAIISVLPHLTGLGFILVVLVGMMLFFYMGMVSGQTTQFRYVASSESSFSRFPSCFVGLALAFCPGKLR